VDPARCEKSWHGARRTGLSARRRTTRRADGGRKCRRSRALLDRSGRHTQRLACAGHLTMASCPALDRSWTYEGFDFGDDLALNASASAVFFPVPSLRPAWRSQMASLMSSNLPQVGPEVPVCRNLALPPLSSNRSRPELQGLGLAVHFGGEGVIGSVSWMVGGPQQAHDGLPQRRKHSG